MYRNALLAAVLSAATTVVAKDSRSTGVGYFRSYDLVIARMDPIINPGQNTSAHLHHVIGGNGFSNNMKDDDALNSNCTDALTLADGSSYWFAELFFRGRKGLERVRMFQFKAYLFFEATNDQIVPFPPGLRMVQGDPYSRSQIYSSFDDRTNIGPTGAPVQNLRWSCGVSDQSQSPFPRKPDGSRRTEFAGGFPEMPCTDIYSPLAMYIHFPSCYDPSQPFSNFANNTYFPTAVDGGKEDCKPGHLHLPHLFFEIIFDTTPFNDRWDECDDKQPFVLANGDPTGFSKHADFIAGWKTDVLDHIIKTCDIGAHGNGHDSCPGVESQPNNSTESCSVTPPVPDNITGPIDKLPGCNPLQYGPERAVACDCSSGEPVCNGKPPASGPSSTAPISTAQVSTSTTATTTATTTEPTSTVEASTSSTASTESTESTTTESTSSVEVSTSSTASTEPTESAGDDAASGTATTTAAQSTSTDVEGEGEEDDGDSCDAPESSITKPKASPVPMIRRSLDLSSHSHSHFHRHRAWKA